MKLFRVILIIISISFLSYCVSTQSIVSEKKIPQYEEVLKDHTIQQGVGFPGLVTVYDTPKEMYELLGTPREDMERPFTYFYDTGAFSLTFVCEFNRKDMNFRIDQIHLDEDPQQLLLTANGIGIGDTKDEVIDVYGPHFDAFTDGIAYWDEGIGFLLDNNDIVTKIVVYRLRKPEVPKWLEPQKYDGELSQQEFIQMQMNIPSDWIKSGVDAECLIEFEPPDHSAFLMASYAIEEENFTFDGFVQLEVALFIEKNLIPEKDRWLEPDILMTFNANRGFIAQSLINEGTRRSYMLILEKERYPQGLFENYYYSFSLDIDQDTLNFSIEPDENEVGLVSAIFRSIQLDDPLLPSLEENDITAPYSEAILITLQNIIDACVFKQLDVLCTNLSYKSLPAPLDPTNEEDLEMAESYRRQINNFFQGRHYKAISLLTDDEEYTWFGLEIMNHNNEKAIFGFVEYDQEYLLGDID
ncbi:MAG: hypothetical protein J7M10_07615 [Candidatus Cloacimonetes bacterium]|nr:hypothetical protein [Candidatus Cloacimonadota bacterium]